MTHLKNSVADASISVPPSDRQRVHAAFRFSHANPFENNRTDTCMFIAWFKHASSLYGMKWDHELRTLIILSHEHVPTKDDEHSYISAGCSFSCLERSNMWGVFRPNKKRPIIRKFVWFTLKQDILFSASKFRNTAYWLSEDFSLKTRNERKIILEFAKKHNAKF